MNLQSYINNDILPLLTNYPVRMVEGMFADCTFTHFPVVEDHKLLGNISEEDLEGFETDKKISDYMYMLDVFFVKKNTSWLDVLEAFARNNANVMPVLDEDDNYLGYYELIDVIGLFKETPFLNEPGGILIVEKGTQDYTFSEISQIVESNDGKLLGAFVSDAQEDLTQITLKVGNVGLNNILQTFRRYGYNIVSGNEDDSYVESLKRRSEYLSRYLNI
ncbi:CBS domain-containing protein [Robertkochia solimangrovi]|uniref:CBS domain-containing protein n=1 Tax=Robertkochia solimangrovi TaxID=2213046 RepID=UPI00117F5006|nr:CBS domain-containing protein [Robertkochia solimangrovi]TRZ44423.1 acetoin utilization protein acuB [Robertkochia solimangrovi]